MTEQTPTYNIQPQNTEINPPKNPSPPPQTQNSPPDQNAIQLSTLKHLLSQPGWDSLPTETQKNLARLKILGAYYYATEQREKLGLNMPPQATLEVLLPIALEKDALQIYLRMCNQVNNKSLLPQEIYTLVWDLTRNYFSDPLVALRNASALNQDDDETEEDDVDVEEDQETYDVLPNS